MNPLNSFKIALFMPVRNPSSGGTASVSYSIFPLLKHCVHLRESINYKSINYFYYMKIYTCRHTAIQIRHLIAIKLVLFK